MSVKSDSSDKDYNPEDSDIDNEDTSEDDEINNAKKENTKGEKNNSNDTKNESKEREFVGPAISDGHKFNNKLVCIKYPGNVVNPEKAVETLGGLVNISEVSKTKNKRLELRFRPDDGYCKPACGDRHQTAGFLLRIRVKKSRREKLEVSHLNGTTSNTKPVSLSNCNPKLESKSNGNPESITDEEKHSSQGNESKCTNGVEDESVNILTNEIIDCTVSPKKTSKGCINTNKMPTFDRNKYEDLSKDAKYQLPKLKVLGRVDSEFRYSNLCDFQYLPIMKSLENPSKDECVYDSVFPVDLPPYSWLKKEVPYFLPPAAFSRMDSVQPYVPKTETNNTDESVIGKTRKRRAGFSNFISFKTPGVPVNPPKGIETAMKVKFLQSSHVEKIRQYFNERPIWSKTALMYLTKFTNEQMKVLLPSVAYYFMTGPWRITWVRLGYDPRKDPKSRIYQVLDYRLKAMHGLHSSVTCKRNYADYALPYKNVSNSKAKPMVIMPQANKTQKQQKLLDENVYIYRPGIIPPSRQMFYQYCDVHVDEIQKILAKYVDPPPGTQCNEKSGWLSKDFDSFCREIINKQVRLELRKMHKIPENLPTSLPRKRKPAPPSGKKRKRYPKKPKKEKPPANPESPMDDIPSNDEIDSEWEDIADIIEEDDYSANESDMDPEIPEEDIEFTNGKE